MFSFSIFISDETMPFDYLRQIFYTDDSPPPGDRGAYDDDDVGTADMMTIGNARLPQCPHCHRFYDTSAKLKAHIQKYCLKEKKYKCFYCVYRSKRRDHIRRHMHRVHVIQLEKRLSLGLSMEIEPTNEDGEVIVETDETAGNKNISRKRGGAVKAEVIDDVV